MGSNYSKGVVWTFCIIKWKKIKCCESDLKRRKIMGKSRRANAVIFGFDFQVNAAIVLMLENIIDLESLKLEGNYEDIELRLNTGEYILAQAKAVEKSSIDFRNVRANLEKALSSLSEGAEKSQVSKLILITNSPNPLNESLSRNLFLGMAHRGYETLPDESRKLIQSYINKIEHPLELNKFMIQVLPFETDDELERYKMVRQVVDDFVGELNLNIPGGSKKILNIWQNEIFKNGSKKDETILLKKNNIIWPIMVLATDVEKIDECFLEVFDRSLYEEIIYRYKEIIDSCCERCEFFIKVLYDYQQYESDKKSSEKCIDFALTQWEAYREELKLDNSEMETEKGLIQIILYSIIRNRIVINRIKKAVNL